MMSGMYQRCFTVLDLRRMMSIWQLYSKYVLGDNCLLVISSRITCHAIVLKNHRSSHTHGYSDQSNLCVCMSVYVHLTVV